jgi:DNA-binding PadR family transcriptional regulator
VSERELSVAEWAVLALVAEQPSHGFALARELAEPGAVGRIWTVPRPLVYRALETLGERGLVRAEGEEPGTRGPRRTIVRATPAGRRRVRAWLHRPVEHVRDVRTLFLLKLLFLARAGLDAGVLVERQRSTLEPVIGGLESRLASAEGFERTIVLWRLESATATLRFLDRLEAPSAP